MRLRVARKIIKAMNTPRETVYAGHTLTRAVDITCRTRESREAQRSWDAMMRYLGPSGRAQLMAHWGKPAEALRLLMDTPIQEWAGDKTAFGKVDV